MLLLPSGGERDCIWAIAYHNVWWGKELFGQSQQFVLAWNSSQSKGSVLVWLTGSFGGVWYSLLQLLPVTALWACLPPLLLLFSLCMKDITDWSNFPPHLAVLVDWWFGEEGIGLSDNPAEGGWEWDVSHTSPNPPPQAALTFCKREPCVSTVAHACFCWQPVRKAAAGRCGTAAVESFWVTLFTGVLVWSGVSHKNIEL